MRCAAPRTLRSVAPCHAPLCCAALFRFILSVQYNYGTEMVTLVTILGTILLTPLVIGYLEWLGAIGVFDYILQPAIP